MTGIVNSTGAKSGIIGTTVGTPPAGGGGLVWAGWNSDATYSNFSGSAPTASGGGGDERSEFYYTMPLQTTATGITLNTDYCTKGTFGTNEPNTQTSYTGKDSGGAYFQAVKAGVYMFYVEGALYQESGNQTRHRARKTPDGGSPITVYGTQQMNGDDFESGHHWNPFSYSGTVNLAVDDKLHFDGITNGGLAVWNDASNPLALSGHLALWFMNT